MLEVNTLNKRSYIKTNLLYTAIGFMSYWIIFMWPISGLSYSVSKMILMGIFCVFLTAGIICYQDANRNRVSAFANVAFPLGIYTTLAYMPLNQPVFLVILSVFGIVVAANAVRILRRRRQNGQTSGHPHSQYIRQIIYNTHLVLAIASVCAILFIGISMLFGVSTVWQTADATMLTESYEQEVENNMETILQLQEGQWGGLILNFG